MGKKLSYLRFSKAYPCPGAEKTAVCMGENICPSIDEEDQTGSLLSVKWTCVTIRTSFFVNLNMFNRDFKC